MKTKEEWACWVLTKREIDSAAAKLSLNPRRLTEKDYRNIARKFTIELRRENRQWQLILEDAIERLVRW